MLGRVSSTCTSNPQDLNVKYSHSLSLDLSWQTALSTRLSHLKKKYPTSFQMSRTPSSQRTRSTTIPLCRIEYAQGTSTNCENLQDFTVSSNPIFYEWDDCTSPWMDFRRSQTYPSRSFWAQVSNHYTKACSLRFPSKDEALTRISQISQSGVAVMNKTIWMDTSMASG